MYLVSRSRYSDFLQSGLLRVRKPNRLRGPPSLLYYGYRVCFPEVNDRYVALTTHPVLAPSLNVGRAILEPLLCTWLVCWEIAFTFYYISYVLVIFQ
jgi:hypothetical protein